ncbi:MAG: UbiD family decarboxylase [Phycisphaera sp.]|nr:MAG: UbiD family decarboxylase [Phycisphaera sp.]
MDRDLRSFVETLRQAGELLEITEPVSPVHDIAELAHQASKTKAPKPCSTATQQNDPRFHDRGGPALLFRKPEGSDFPVLINAFGSYRRMEMALGDKGLETIANTIAELTKPQPPRSFGEVLQKAKQFAPLLKIGPKRLKSAGPCQQVVRTGEAIDLTRLPMLRCWPLDGDFEAVGYPAGINDGIEGLGHPDISEEEWNARYRGRYITLAGIHTIHADDRNEKRPASHNIGMYRVQLLGKDRVAMHWHLHHDGASHWRSWKRLGEPMPVAIALGGPSVLPYAATAPLPPGISELLMAGFLNGKGIRMCRAKTVPLWVPADAEMSIEGLVSTEAGSPGWDPRETDEPLGPGAVFEGPFGDHTGFYSMPDRYPIVKVTAFTHRENAIYPTTVVGLPPQEDYFLGKATERLFLPLLKTIVHDIEDYDLPLFGAFHNCAMVQINKAYAMQGRRVMASIWGAGQMAWTKCLFIVDQGVNVHDTEAVLRFAAERCDPLADVVLTQGPLDILDHAAPDLGAGTKIGFDCTTKMPGDRLTDDPPIRSLPDPQRIVSGVDGAAMPVPGWLFIATEARGKELESIWQRVQQALGDAVPFVVFLGQGVNVHNVDEAMFHFLANSDPGRDALSTDAGLRVRAWDATPKTTGTLRGQGVRAWPPVIRSDPDAVEQTRSIASKFEDTREVVGPG